MQLAEILKLLKFVTAGVRQRWQAVKIRPRAALSNGENFVLLLRGFRDRWLGIFFVHYKGLQIGTTGDMKYCLQQTLKLPAHHFLILYAG